MACIQPHPPAYTLTQGSAAIHSPMTMTMMIASQRTMTTLPMPRHGHKYGPYAHSDQPSAPHIDIRVNCCHARIPHTITVCNIPSDTVSATILVQEGPHTAQSMMRMPTPHTTMRMRMRMRMGAEGFLL